MILRYDQGMNTHPETPRPMPEPLECTCMNRGNSCLTCLDAIGWDPDASCPSCPVHAGPTYSETERLTDATDHSEHEGAPTMSTPTAPRMQTIENATRDDVRPGDREELPTKPGAVIVPAEGREYVEAALLGDTYYAREAMLTDDLWRAVWRTPHGDRVRYSLLPEDITPGTWKVDGE